MPKKQPTAYETQLKAAKKALGVLENGHISRGTPRDRTHEMHWAEREASGEFSCGHPGVARFNLEYHKIMHEAWQAQVKFVRKRVDELTRLVEMEHEQCCNG